jgi:subtilase family serine protease
MRRRARIHVEQLEARNLLSFTPKQIVHAYGIDQLYNSGLNGSGQTIAIIDAYYTPTIQSDLATFSTTYGLAQLDGKNGDGTFTQVDLTNNQTPSPAGDDWTLEVSLDVEWAHAVAPKANILLVAAKSDLTDPVTGEPTDLLNAVAYANAQKVSTVSMSWGLSEVPGETSWDTQFFPTNNGITYFAASGDSGAGTIWPAVSPNVVAVGGTTLKLTASNTISSETGWGNGIFSSYFGGSGGGFSVYEKLPTYQAGITTVSNGFKLTDFGARLSPDVAYVANPNTGVSVLDTTDGGWFTVGGTSAGSPQWAALVAIADQGRATPLSGNQTLKAIYSSSNSSGFRDITSGSSTGAYSVYDNLGNFLGTLTVKPQTGYDMVTGQGSPKANVLVPNLVNGVGLSAVRTAAATQPTSPRPTVTGNTGKSGAKDMPLGNGSTTQGLISVSLALTSAQSPIAFVVQPANVNVPAVQPVPLVAPSGQAGSAVSLYRSAFAGGSDSLDDRFAGAEPLNILPAEFQEDKPNPGAPSGSEALLDDSSTSLMNRNRLDAYFSMAASTEDLAVGNGVTNLPAQDQSSAPAQPEAAIFGLVALLGGCWTVHESRDEKKKAYPGKFAN